MNLSGEKIWNDGEKSVIKAGIMAVVIENKDKPHLQNLANVYNFLTEMCTEQTDKTMLIDIFLDSLPRNHPAVISFAPARIAPSRTRGSFFTSALNTLAIFTDEYIIRNDIRFRHCYRKYRKGTNSPIHDIRRRANFLLTSKFICITNIFCS